MMTPSSDQVAAAVALVDAQAHVRQAVTDQGVAGVVALVRGFDQWWSSKAITDLVHQITSILQPRQRIIAGSTDAYLARMLTILTDRLASPVGPISVDGLRSGTTMPDAYGRLADNYRYLISQGNDPQQALDTVAARAASMATTDMDLAMRDQSQAFMVHKVVTGYRRVIHPELSQGGTCGLCAVASDRVYHKAELMPIHANCKCSVMPIVGGIDLGGQINADDLQTLYDQAGGNTAAQLKRTRYLVSHHGELGPVLTDRGDNFRSPQDVAA